ncbi:MAG TPA: hypothetical protein P5306_09400 [Kiritimatiellia bacterium]|nr:hypothetical protein [Kiritimatiellia bacterium]
MNKTLTLIAIAALAAGTASAQHGGPPPGCDGTGPMAGKAMRGPEDRGPGREMRGGPVSDEMRAEMRAEHQAIRDLVGAARVETDETRKAELVEQIRAKLGAVADRMQAHQEERLAQAEERFTALKERIEDARERRDEIIEDQIQRLLAGERPERPAAFDDFPYAKGGRAKGEGRPDRGPRGMRPPPPPPEEPLPGDIMPDDMPPPPEE